MCIAADGPIGCIAVDKRNRTRTQLTEPDTIELGCGEWIVDVELVGEGFSKRFPEFYISRPQNGPLRIAGPSKTPPPIIGPPFP